MPTANSGSHAPNTQEANGRARGRASLQAQRNARRIQWNCQHVLEPACYRDEEGRGQNWSPSFTDALGTHEEAKFASSHG
eukprot:2632278-Amphidinium_carterae.1